MSNPTIAMIGYGCVGRATAEAFHSKSIKVIGIDPVIYPKSKIENALAAGIAMICVPTPMFDSSGRQDVTVVMNVVKELSRIEYKGLIVVKSTVLPTFVMQLLEDFAHLRIVTNPEFLTERFAKSDAEKPTTVVIGGPDKEVRYLRDFYVRLDMIASDNIWTCSAPVAMLYKYIYNVLGAVTISVMNEFKLLHDKLGLDHWDHIHGFMDRELIFDERTHVPGPDGKLGFGGKCFPKDINAIINMARDLEVPAETLEGAIATNHVVRKGE